MVTNDLWGCLDAVFQPVVTRRSCKIVLASIPTNIVKLTNSVTEEDMEPHKPNYVTADEALVYCEKNHKEYNDRCFMCDVRKAFDDFSPNNRDSEENMPEKCPKCHDTGWYERTNNPDYDPNMNTAIIGGYCDCEHGRRRYSSNKPVTENE